MRVAIAVSLLLISISCSAQSELILAENLKMNIEPVQTISHTEDMLILVYEDWRVAHEVMDPKWIYPGVDLSGMEKVYVRSLFEPQAREDLPAWLAVLSKEQAETFGIDQKSVVKRTIGEALLLAAYDPGGAQGEIFVIDGKRIHHFQVLGQEKEFDGVIKRLVERKDGAR